MKVVLSSAALATLEHVARAADVGLRTTYPGRGMYGRTCLAVVGHPTTLVRFAFALAEEVATGLPDEGERLGELVDAMRSSHVSHDSMGHDTVYYWRGVELEEA